MKKKIIITLFLGLFATIVISFPISTKALSSDIQLIGESSTQISIPMLNDTDFTFSTNGDSSSFSTLVSSDGSLVTIYQANGSIFYQADLSGKIFVISIYKYIDIDDNINVEFAFTWYDYGLVETTSDGIIGLNFYSENLTFMNIFRFDNTFSFNYIAEYPYRDFRGRNYVQINETSQRFIVISFPQLYEYAYNEGYSDALAVNPDSCNPEIVYKEVEAEYQSNLTKWIWALFGGITGFLNIRIGNISIGAIILIPLAITLAWFIIRSLRGGGSG